MAEAHSTSLDNGKARSRKRIEETQLCVAIPLHLAWEMLMAKGGTGPSRNLTLAPTSTPQNLNMWSGELAMEDSMDDVTLTKRQKEILLLIVTGKSRKEIADELGITVRTVDGHLANLYDKLQVSNRVQAFRRATRLGLID